MKVSKLLSLVKALKPTAIAMEDELLLHWISEIEGVVLSEVLMVAPASIEEITEASDAELAAKYPYDRLYLQYLTAQIDYANGEYDKFANSMQMFNTYMGEYQRYVGTCLQPGNGRAELSGYYLSAYGLALTRGFDGTLDEWLESLQGAPGKTSYLYAKIVDGCLVIVGGESDDIQFAINASGELEVIYG